MDHDCSHRMHRIKARSWRDKTRIELEEAADRIITELGDSRQRIYSERQLARKIRLEEARMSEVEETSLPPLAVDYIIHEQARLLISAAKLNKLQGAVLILVLEGFSVIDISCKFSIPCCLVERELRRARNRIKRARSPYDGLYEVYWSEVHRYVYRKPRADK